MQWDYFEKKLSEQEYKKWLEILLIIAFILAQIFIEYLIIGLLIINCFACACWFGLYSHRLLVLFISLLISAFLIFEAIKIAKRKK